MISIYLVAIAGIYFNFKTCQHIPKSERKNTLLTFGVFLAIVALVAYIVPANYSMIYEFRSVQIQSRIAQEINGLDTFEEKIQFLVNKGNIPSMAIGIIVDDQLVVAEAFGDSNADTAYSTGSVTKMFTATAVMQLYEQGACRSRQ